MRAAASAIVWEVIFNAAAGVCSVADLVSVMIMLWQDGVKIQLQPRNIGVQVQADR
jgi:hypothetical protein